MSAARLDSPEATERCGRRVGAALHVEWPAHPAMITLTGELGAGKTTWVRGLLQGLGWRGAVRSPTYTLVEPYDLPAGRVYHIDLYRLAGGAELDALGFREMATEPALCLVEWPERGGDALPPPDLEVRLAHAGDGRTLAMRARTGLGERLGAAACDDLSRERSGARDED